MAVPLRGSSRTQIVGFAAFEDIKLVYIKNFQKQRKSDILSAMFKKIAKSTFLQNILASLLSGYIKFVYMTSRFELVGEENFTNKILKTNKSVIGLFWHGRLMMIPYFARFYTKTPPMAALTSLHRDGRLIAKILENLGFRIVGGSRAKTRTDRKVSEGGGVKAFLELQKLLTTEKTYFGTPPDGPKGPFQHMSKGMLMLAQKTGVPVMLVSYSVKRAKVFKTWDKFMLALPFNKGVFMYGGIFTVPKDLSGEAFEKFRKEKEDELTRLTEEADRKMGRIK